MWQLVLDEPHNLAYGSDPSNSAVWVFSLPTMAFVMGIPTGPQSDPIGIDVSADGATLAVARKHLSDIALYKTADGSLIGTLTRPAGWAAGTPEYVHFGRSGRLYSAGRDSVDVWDLAGLVGVGHSACCAMASGPVSITSDSNTMYDTETLLGGTRVARYDIIADTPVLTGATPNGNTGADTDPAVIRPDGSRVYRADGAVWSGDLMTQSGHLATSCAALCISYAPRTDSIVESDWQGGAVGPASFRKLDGTTLALTGSRFSTGFGFPIAVNSAGNLAYQGTRTGLDFVSFDRPDAPTGVTTVPGIGSALVSWMPPADPGTSPITSYDLVSSSGVTTSFPATQTSAVFKGLVGGLFQSVTIDAVNSSGPSHASAPSPSVIVQGGGTYHALSPVRILDTREGTGGISSPIGAGGTVTLQVAGRGGVPSSGVSGVILNVTVTDTTASSFLTLWPAGSLQPPSSSLNWTAGETVPNEVAVAPGAGGQVNIFNLGGSADVVVDLEGYVGDSTNSTGPPGMFNAVTPSRLLDTRVMGGTLGQSQTLTLQVTGRGGVPATGVSAVILNVTVTDTTASSYLTVYPTGGGAPVVSNLNWVAGQTVPNRVIVPVGPGGQVNVFNFSGSTDVIVDVNGWFTDPTNTGGGGGLVVFGSCCVARFDTRVQGGTLGPGSTLTVPFGTDRSSYMGLLLNVTVTNTTGASFLTVWPAATPMPLASDLNWVAGQTVANLTPVVTSTTGFEVFNLQGSTDVVIDVEGSFSAAVKPLTP
jgi:hypothetical protein